MELPKSCESVFRENRLTIKTILYACMIGAALIFSAINKCASQSERLVFTKDWIVVLANVKKMDNDDEKIKTKNNVDENECASTKKKPGTELSRFQRFQRWILICVNTFRMNSMIVSIGQATSIISPVFVGILLDYIGQNQSA